MEEISFYEKIKDNSFRLAVVFLDKGNSIKLKKHLHENPRLLDQHIAFDETGYFANPCLLNFVAENPVRNGTLPPNIVNVTRIILEAGAKKNLGQINETLGLVCSGRIVRECKSQIPLIALLHYYGADLNAAMLPALSHGSFDAIRYLINLGAQVRLHVAAAIGDIDGVTRLMPVSGATERHLALAFAAQYGHPEILKTLLESGEDPDRYNPPQAHGSSTPLHQAILAGHESVVKLLVEAGASLDIKDKVYHGTALDWAVYSGNNTIENYLRLKADK